MLELRRGDLPSKHGRHDVYGLLHRHLFDGDGVRPDCQLRQLRRRDLHRVDGFDLVCRLLGGNIPRKCGVIELRGMRGRFLLV